jgi:hypothetical protein
MAFFHIEGGGVEAIRFCRLTMVDHASETCTPQA